MPVYSNKLFNLRGGLIHSPFGLESVYLLVDNRPRLSIIQPFLWIVLAKQSGMEIALKLIA